MEVFTSHIQVQLEMRCNNDDIEPLSQISSNYTEDQLAILLGDLNILDGFVEGQVPREVCFELLENAGWNLIKEEGVDLIYFSSKLLDMHHEILTNIDSPLLSRELGGMASDHEPIAVDVFFP